MIQKETEGKQEIGLLQSRSGKMDEEEEEEFWIYFKSKTSSTQ